MTDHHAADTDPLAAALIQVEEIVQIGAPIDQPAAQDDLIKAQRDAAIQGLARRQHEIAEFGANLALISLARDVRRITDELASSKPEDDKP